MFDSDSNKKAFFWSAVNLFFWLFFFIGVSVLFIQLIQQRMDLLEERSALLDQHDALQRQLREETSQYIAMHDIPEASYGVVRVMPIEQGNIRLHGALAVFLDLKTPDTLPCSAVGPLVLLEELDQDNASPFHIALMARRYCLQFHPRGAAYRRESGVWTPAPDVHAVLAADVLPVTVKMNKTTTISFAIRFNP